MIQTSSSVVSRVIVIVMDGVGIGAQEDAGLYGDEGSATLQNIAEEVGGLELPVLASLGLGSAAFLGGGPIAGVDASKHRIGFSGIMRERSPGKDSTTGHWEIAGLVLSTAFPTYPEGFPPSIIERFENEIGTRVLGNRAASGTEIVEALGEEHMRTGYPIVYTSADSVFQIAAHVSIISPEELYRFCRIARRILTGPHDVGRVIARPFEGVPGQFRRTEGRKDFSVPPPDQTLLEAVSDAGKQVIGFGKIEDIFCGRGLTESVHTTNTGSTMKALNSSLGVSSEGLLIANCIDFDMLYGHRNDAAGYAEALVSFDWLLAETISLAKDSDLILVSADHGNDPTTPSTDHSREFVPLLAYRGKSEGLGSLGIRDGFSDISATASEALLGEVYNSKGESFFGRML